MRGERERCEARSADEEVISVGEGDREWTATGRQASPTLRELSGKAAPKRFTLISRVGIRHPRRAVKVTVQGLASGPRIFCPALIARFGSSYCSKSDLKPTGAGR